MESYGEGARVRQTSYACDITFGTNSEFGFDYLRDNLKIRLEDQVQVPQDLVGSMLFMASPLADFMTGHSLVVDGGINMR